MTDAQYQPVRVSRRIAAPADVIFRVLADPRRHIEFDGSGSLRGSVTTDVISAVGDVFVMKMYFDHLGDYEMNNHVVEYEPGKRIGWEPEAGRGHPEAAADDARWGHRWSYELEPEGPAATVVTETYDCSLAPEWLRNAVKGARDAKTDAARAQAQAQMAAEKGHVRQIVSVLQGDLKNAKAVLDEKAIDPADAEAVTRAASDKFWQDFDKDPFNGLEFLENRIASQAADADLLFLNYVGTDFQAFQKSFDRMKIVEGTMVPPGKRGFLFAKQVYEDQLKLKAARRLDKIKEGVDSQGETIATDPDLKRMVRENTSQVREILLQLDAQKTLDFRAKLQRELASTETDLGKLLVNFFQTDDQNFHQRYDFFYQELAPSLELYRVRIGDVLTIKAFTRSGYVQSVNVPVYGTFQFQGLEKSTLAGALNLMDMVSFRELYGFMSGAKLAEIQALQKEAGARDISRENAEAELFGKADAPEAAPAAKAPRHIEATTTPGVSAVTHDLGESLGGKLQREEARSRVFPAGEVEQGVVLNAAVIVKDPKKIKETIAAIEAQGKLDGLTLKAIDWQQAAGLIGQFVNVIRMVLYVAILIIFIIALVIINNALVMATLERVKEIGTLRAIGAQRRFILAMLVVESIVVGVIFGGLGALLGALIVTVVGKIGIPAKSDIWFFFFSGPRLYPFIGTSNVIAAFVIVLLVSAFSSFYPAWIAMRVTPRQAMAEEE